MGNTLTGNKVNILINGQIIGSGVQSVGADTDFGLQDADGIGSALPYEHIVGKVTHSITLEKYVISKENLIALGYVPNDETLLTSGTIDIAVVGKDGTPEFVYVNCSAANHRMNIVKHAISGENATFRALNKISV